VSLAGEGLETLLSFAFEIVPEWIIGWPPVFGGRARRLVRPCASALLFCFLEGIVRSFEAGRRLRERSVAGIVSLIFNGVAMVECAWRDGEGSAWGKIWMWV